MKTGKKGRQVIFNHLPVSLLPLCNTSILEAEQYPARLFFEEPDRQKQRTIK